MKAKMEFAKKDAAAFVNEANDPLKPSFLFAPGAGAPSTNPWMQKWKQYLLTIGEVTLFDYEYMRKGRRRPDPLPQLLAAHRQALVELRQKISGQVFLIGKSMGGRV